MKRTALLLSLCIGAIAANAQTTPYSLTGTSYLQNFDNIGTGLPVGWNGYLSATSTDTGTVYVDLIGGVPQPFGSTTYGRYNNASGTDSLAGQCPTDIFGAGFKNVPSADAGAGTTQMNCAQEQTVTNRAFGLRQKGSGGYDPGAAYTFVVANTSGRTGFAMDFNLQTLDTTCPRVTTWEVDYGIGATPSVFTPVTTSPASLTTGGYTFGSTAVHINFGAALDNISQPVWIRIATLVATTNSLGGNGTRTTSAIDDFKLTWAGPTGVNNVSAQPTLSLSVLGMATSEKVALVYNAEEAGNYTLSIYDISGRVIYTEVVSAQAGTQTITVNALHLMPGMYIAKMNNSNTSSVARIAVQ